MALILNKKKKTINHKIAEAGWVFPNDTYDCLSDYEKSFLELEFTGIKTIEYYKQRLRMLGFCGKGKLLDAACGMGQWSAALADLNEQVQGIDIDVGRLLIAKELCRGMGKQNAKFSYASMDALPYRESSCDGIFCYGAFMFSDMPKTIGEFNRVLRPGGQLYININLIGWYAHLLFDRGIKQRNIRMMWTVLKIIRRTLMFKKRNVIMGQNWLKNTLQKKGFSIIAQEPEGHICISEQIKKEEPTYKKRYYGMPGVTEIIAYKI